MRLKAMLTDMSSVARIALATSSLCEAETDLFAFPGGDEAFAILGLLWVIACTSLLLTLELTLAATFAATSSTTF